MRTKHLRTPCGWQRLKPHPLSQITEFGSGLDMEAFEAFVAEHGYDTSEPIVIHEGMILDGRHKHAVCAKLGVVPKFALFIGADAKAFCLKKIHRQHLDASQRAMIAARLATLPVGRPSEETLQICRINPTVEEAAETLNVSARSVHDAKTVLDAGTPELIKEVQTGEKAVSTAAAEVKVKSRFCPRCQRLGPVKHCPQCAEVQERHEPKKPKLGKELFPWAAYTAAYAKLVRMVDALGAAYGLAKIETPEKTALHGQLAEFHKGMQGWKTKLTKERPPE